MVDHYSRTGSPALSNRAAFAHVVAVHRAFATALAASEHYGLPSGDTELSALLNDKWLREVGTVFRDSLLMNGRNLIHFYASVRKPENGRTALDTDVLLDDFGLPRPRNAARLATYRDSISSHVVHITAWRDLGFRATNLQSERDWIDWNTHTSTFGDEVVEALADTAAGHHAWAPAFGLLLDACQQRRSDPTCHWPLDLSDPESIDRLLLDLGL